MLNPFGRSPNDQFVNPNPFSQPLGLPPATSSPAASSHDADERVARALESEQFEYEINDNGNYRVVVKFSEDNRTQLTIIGSKTQTWRGVHWRKVWSKAFQVKGQISHKQALDLLADGDGRVFGGWCIEQSDGQTRVYYQTSVPADASPAELHHAISLVAGVADDMEKKVLKTDAY